MHGGPFGGVERGPRGRRREDPPPLLDPSRRRDRRRVLALFAPHRVRLAAVLSLIAVSAVISMISPFLLRAILDKAIPHHDITLLSGSLAG